MILTAGFLIGIAATFIEVKLVNSKGTIGRWFRNAYDNGIGPIDGAWCNIGFSIGLSFILGGGFTTIALMGMLFSTVMSAWYFSAQRSLNKAGWDSNRVAEERVKAADWWTENRHHFVNLGKTIMVTIKILTAPIRAAIWANDKAHDGKDRVAVISQNARNAWNNGKTF